MLSDCLPGENVKPYAIYVRVSTIDQHPENQILDLKRYCKDRGIENYDIYEEMESTRKTRPVKAYVMDRLRRFEYQGVIVWHLSRWARSFPELIMELDEFERKNIKLISIRDLGEIDMHSIMGKALVRMIGIFNEIEREWGLERTMAGLKRAKAEGKRLGRPPGATDTKPRKKRGQKTPPVKPIEKTRLEGVKV